MKKVFKFIKGLLTFIKNMLSKGTNESAKRTMAALIIINVIIIAYICLYRHCEAPELVPLMFKGAMLLLGLELTAEIFKSYKK